MSIHADLTRVLAAHAQRERDPLAWWRFAVPRLRTAVSMLREGTDELVAPAPNRTGKSTAQAAVMTAFAQKRTALDGVALPQWRGPVELAQVCLDYPQQVLSVQPAYLRALGTWPHHARYSGEVLKSLRIMPLDGSRDERKWSVIHFLSTENRRTGLGVRSDAVAFDEPPPMSVLREMRKAGHAGRRALRLVWFTPLFRAQWGPLREDYGTGPRDHIRVIKRRWAEVRWSFDEVADWVLSPAERAAQLQDWEGDPLFDARRHGDYCDATGACPFHIPTLEEMLAECTAPLEMVNWRVTQEPDPASGRTRLVRTVPVEVYRHAQHDTVAMVTIDPSAGIDDKPGKPDHVVRQHDPYELQVTEMHTGDLLARSGGYVPGFLVGVLAAGLSRQYNAAPIDVEVNDRWGVNVVEGVQSAQYGNFARERRELRPGEWSHEIGFHNTGKTRPLIIGAVQQWVDNWRAGVRYGRCPSRKVIQCLLDCILDERGRIVGGPGVHDDCLIVRGQALRRTVRRVGVDVPEYVSPPKSHDEELIERLLSKQREREVPLTPPLRAERPRI